MDSESGRVPLAIGGIALRTSCRLVRYLLRKLGVEASIAAAARQEKARSRRTGLFLRSQVRSERSSSVRRSVAGRSIEPGLAGAQVRPAAAPVAPRHDIEER